MRKTRSARGAGESPSQRASPSDHRKAVPSSAANRKMDVRTFLMIGPPGSGKGTQANLLAERIGAQVYSSGSRFREIAASGSYFGNKAKAVMTSGDLMPEWVSIYLFEDVLVTLEPADKIVFDGSGRKEAEARAFHEVAAWLGRSYVVINLEASDSVLRERLLKRRRIDGRADDETIAIDLRLECFKRDTRKSIEYFRSKGVLLRVNGEQPVDAVHRDIVIALDF